MANATAEEETKLEDYTVAELKEMADEQGIQVPSHATKDEIIKAIEKGEKANAKANGKANAKAAGAQDAGVEPLGVPAGPIITLPLANIVADAYGIGRRYNIGLTDIQGLGAVTAGGFLIETLPAGAIVQLVRIKHSQSVAGPGPITAATAQVQDAVNAAYGSAFDIFQAPANTAAAMSTVQLTAANVCNIAATTAVYVAVTSTGGNLGTATAGALSVWLRWTLIA